MKQYEKSDRLMEIGNRFKNEGRLKSQTSRGHCLTFGIALLVFCAFTNKAMAQTWNIGEPDYNSNVSATLSGNTLTISGNGNMVDFWNSTEGEAPWWFNTANRNAIQTVIIQSGVKNIGNRAFKDCNNLQTITIANTVTIIGRQAFYNCTNANLHIKIPKEVATIEGEAFRSCSGIFEIEDGDNTLNFKNFYYQGNEYPWDWKYDWFLDSQIKTLYLGRNYTYDGYNFNTPFRGMFYLQTLTIGNKVTSIDGEAFENCTNLADVTIKDGPSDLNFTNPGIGNYFYQSPIKTLYLGRNLYAMNNSDVYDTNYFPFCEKTSLTTLTIGSYVRSIGVFSFSGCSGLSSPVVIPNSVTSIGNYAFRGCVALPAVTLPNVEKIGRNAFYQCRALTSITIPKSVQSIGNGAFGDCTNLADVTIEDGPSDLSFEDIGGHFYQCPVKTLYLGRNMYIRGMEPPFTEKTSLTTLTIGNNVTAINDYSFQNCTGLESIIIPSNITSVGYSAFAGCNGLKGIYCQNATKPPSAMDQNSFYNVYATCTLYVPTDASIDIYKKEPEWRNFNNITVCTVGITTVPAPQLSIFPNPAQSDLFIKSDSSIEKVEIYSLTGALLILENNFTGKISVTILPKGVYLLKVYTDKGMTITKFVKE